MRRAVVLALALAAPATAAQRRVALGSFERLRVEGPFAVTLATGRSPGGTVTGDARAIEAVEVRQDGGTVVVRPAGETSADRPAAVGPIRVALGTPALAGAALLGGGTLAIAGGRARRLDLSVAGAGAITVTGADAEQANATVIGNGAITLAGRAAKARLLVNGAGRIGADKLDADDLTIRVDGPGEVDARARYTAAVSNTGLGHVAVAGAAKCVVKNTAGGPVTCGAR